MFDFKSEYFVKKEKTLKDTKFFKTFKTVMLYVFTGNRKIFEFGIQMNSS